MNIDQVHIDHELLRKFSDKLKECSVGLLLADTHLTIW